jgi:hypothetical protein
MRNSALMRLIYGRPGEIVVHYAAMLRRAVLSTRPLGQRWHTFRAALASLGLLRHALRKRRQLASLGRHPWVFFNGWNYGDVAEGPSAPLGDEQQIVEPAVPLWNMSDFARAAAGMGEKADGLKSVQFHAAATVGGVSKPAWAMHGWGALSFELQLFADWELTGYVGLAMPAMAGLPKGSFTIEQDDRVLWEARLDPRARQQRRWFRFGVRLRPGNEPLSRLTLRFVSGGRTFPLSGYWGELQVRPVSGQTIGCPRAAA